ncbi:MAG: hypothetical protein F4X44_05915 [Gammaproteobacteria bacterium]|nr:hypothetical protein [Gammaproteobacteria bacterium]MYD80128.1 hypothetical protein [Gammaproteobacteria bacterium]
MYSRLKLGIPDRNGARMVGNLVGDSRQDVEIGVSVKAVFEHHTGDHGSYMLVQWNINWD